MSQRIHWRWFHLQKRYKFSCVAVGLFPLTGYVRALENALMHDRTAQENAMAKMGLRAEIPAVSFPTVSGHGKANHTVLRPIGPRISALSYTFLIV